MTSTSLVTQDVLLSYKHWNFLST